MKRKAPIIVFAYDRPSHLEKVLDALKRNKGFDEAEVFIYQDGLKNDSTFQKDSYWQETNVFLKQFEEIHPNTTLIVRNENFGLTKNVITGVTEILESNDEVIVLEDDIIPHESMLHFFWECLDLYRTIDTVAGISAYSFDGLKSSKSHYFLPLGSSWAWGTWKRIWKDFEDKPEQYRNEILENSLVKQFNVNNTYDYFNMLNKRIDNEIDSWAISFYAYYFLKSKVFIFPHSTLALNIGGDGSGTHQRDDEFTSSGKFTSSPGLSLNFREPTIDDKELKQLETIFKGLNKKKEGSILKKLFKLINHD